MTIGNFGALIQEFAAYPGLFQHCASWLYLIGMAVAPYSDQALPGSLFQIFNHAINEVYGFYLLRLAVATAWQFGLEKYRGLGYRMPITAIALTISLLALLEYHHLMVFGVRW